MRLPVGVTWKDYMRRRWRNPVSAQSLYTPSPQPSELPNQPAHQPVAPQPGSDPMLDLAKSDEAFHDWQRRQGRDLLNSGVGPQTAAEQMQMHLAREYEQAGNLVAPPPIHPLQPNPLQPNPGFAPHNDPMSTVPGGPGTPFKGPMG